MWTAPSLDHNFICPSTHISGKWTIIQFQCIGMAVKSSMFHILSRLANKWNQQKLRYESSWDQIFQSPVWLKPFSCLRELIPLAPPVKSLYVLIMGEVHWDLTRSQQNAEEATGLQKSVVASCHALYSLPDSQIFPTAISFWEVLTLFKVHGVLLKNSAKS